jgi:hypothetical protein
LGSPYLTFVSRSFFENVLPSANVNFTNIKEATFTIKFSSKKMQQVVKLSLQKSCSLNGGEIDTCGQFHQHFMSAFAQMFLRQKKFKPKM